MTGWRGTRRTLVGAMALAAGLGATADGRPARAQAPDATPATCAPMTPEEGRALARRYMDAVNARDSTPFEEIVAPDATFVGGTSGEAAGPDGFAARQDQVFAAFPDHTALTEDVLSDGTVAYVRWTGAGTNEGDYLGTPASGEARAWSAISRFTLGCGQITGIQIMTDQAGVLGMDGPHASGQQAAPPAGAATPAACGRNDPAAMAAAIETLWAKGWNERDAEAFGAVFSDDYVHHHHAGPDTVGLEEGKARIDALVAAVPDLRIDWSDLVVDGDLAAASWTITGTVEGTLFGQEGAGTSVSYSGANIFRFACGEIIETWSEGDVLGALRQLQDPD